MRPFLTVLFIFGPHKVACGILDRNQGSKNERPLQWKWGVLTIGPSEKFPEPPYLNAQSSLLSLPFPGLFFSLTSVTNHSFISLLHILIYCAPLTRSQYQEGKDFCLYCFLLCPQSLEKHMVSTSQKFWKEWFFYKKFLSCIELLFCTGSVPSSLQTRFHCISLSLTLSKRECHEPTLQMETQRFRALPDCSLCL